MGKAERAVKAAKTGSGNYDFEYYGYVLVNQIAPSLNLGAETKIGVRIAIPVVKK